MCYSKEVSLVAGAVISGLSYWYYLKFYLRQKAGKSINAVKGLWEMSFAKTIKPSIDGFSLWFILGFAAIGGHQIGEFLSIATGSQLIYKLGLISSIACTYFMMVAFEKLAGRRLGSRLIALVIFFVSIAIFRTEMVFANTHFWVRGLDHTVWSVFWLANWMYLCLSIILLSLKATVKSNKRLYVIYGLGGINISFFLSWIYAIVAHRYGTTCTIVSCSYHFLNDFVYEFDFPSLWCTFTVLQSPFIYLVLKKMRAGYKKETFNNWQPTIKTQLGLIIATAFVMAAWYLLTPMLLGVSWKMMTK